MGTDLKATLAQALVERAGLIERAESAEAALRERDEQLALIAAHVDRDPLKETIAQAVWRQEAELTACRTELGDLQTRVKMAPIGQELKAHLLGEPK